MSKKKVAPPDREEYVTVPEAAGILKCHPNTVRAWVRQGKLVLVPIGPERIGMLRKADVLALQKPLEAQGALIHEDKRSFPVVGIGSSAGGLDAITRLLKELPTDLGLAYVFVTHMDTDGEPVLIELLKKRTSMPVLLVENGMRLQPDRLYVAPAGMQLSIVEGTLTLQVLRTLSGAVLRPIDAFFRSLAEEYQNNAIGIVLSGSGMDGTEGLRAIKEADGLTFAQDSSAQSGDMPRNAQEADVVDVVRKPEDIAHELTELVKELYPDERKAIPSKHENELRRILQYLREKRGVDFSQYKEATIHRRIIRRMVLSKCRKLADYDALLRSVPGEVDTLYSDLLINVTSFFRDPRFHEALVQRVFPALLAERAPNEPLRIWVAACAGGEEVVSIAITLLEYLGDRAMSTPVQIFATDLNERTIEKARLGIYTKSAVSELSPERLKRFFTHVDGHFHVVRAVRDMCVFAKHDLLEDPPFSRVEMISCQNVLIYMENAAQARVLRSFHYALKPNGFLLLGKSETTASAGEIFLQPEREFKLYRKKLKGDERVRLDLHFKPMVLSTSSAAGERQPLTAVSPGRDLGAETDKVLMQRFMPPSVLVNKDLDIIRFQGNTAPFLGPTTGRASLNLLKMVRDDLAFELRTLLTRARKKNVAVSRSGSPVRINDGVNNVGLEVVPMGHAQDVHYLVVFKDEGRVAEARTPKTGKGHDVRDERIASLEQELRETREQVRHVSEDAEITNQELQSANEEVVSSNEELQSINEELETSKEELQSINEEFATINEELQVRNDALRESEERYRQLIQLMPVAVYTCDAQGHVRLYNDAAVKLWGREPVIGEDLWCGSARMFTTDGKGMALDKCPMAIAIKEAGPITDAEAIVERPSGERRFVLANPTPLFDQHRTVIGAINVLVDITDRRKAEDHLRESEKRYRQLMDTLPVAVFTCNTKGRILLWNAAAVALWGRTPEGAEGEWHGAKGLLRIDGTPLPREQSPIAIAMRENLWIRGEEVLLERPDGTRRRVLVHPEPIHDEQGHVIGGHNVLVDVTDRRDSEERLRVATSTGKLGIWDWDIVGNLITWTDPVYAIHGVDKDAFVPTMEGYSELIHPEDRARVSEAIRRSLQNDVPYEIEFRTLNPAGQVNWVFTNAVVMREGERPVRMLGGTMNITDRKRIEEDLRNSERQYRSLFDNMSAGIAYCRMIVDEHGAAQDYEYLATNGAYEEMTGRKDVIGRRATELTPGLKEKYPTALAAYGRVAGTGIAETFEMDFSPRGWLGISAFSPQKGYFVSVFEDISARKLGEDAMRRLAAIVESSEDAILSADREGIITSWNLGSEHIYGYTASEIIGRPLTQLTPESRTREAIALHESVLEGDRVEHFATERIRKDGSIVEVALTISPIRDDTGRIIGTSKIARDITEQRKAEAVIRASEQRFHRMADSAPMLIWVSDVNKRYTWFNKPWLEFVGHGMDEELGTGWEKNIHPDDKAESLSIFNTSFDARRPFTMDLRMRRSDGEYRWIMDHGTPMFDNDGHFSGYIGSCVDITDRKNAERELEDSARHKDYFLATLAHELRSPLAPLKNGLQLWGTEVDRTDTGLRTMMERQLDHMVRLVDDLMDLSRISRGRIELRRERLDLARVVATALEAVRPVIEHRGHTLEVALAEDVLEVDGDETRLTQVISNLLHNSARYTDEGGRIALRVAREGDKAVVSVQDNGVGIEPAALNKVFEMFAQVDPDQKTKPNGGLGIGLHIVKRLMEMHGGSVQGFSEGVGKGSVFTVELPLLPNDPERKNVAPPSVAPMKVTPRRILVVDDNQDAAFTMSLILRKRGHEVDVANDGEQAVIAAERFRPEIIFMDIGMPKMNGYEACATMRKEAWGKDVTIIALSGWGQEQDRQLSGAAGFNEHIVKPVDGATLERLIASAN